MSDSIITADLLRRLEQMQLLARRRSKAVTRGERRSKARGQSVEFADHRNYAHGDDFRNLDWNLYGRLDKLFLKLYEEERELPVTIFLDASESMTFGTPAKFHYARQIAAAIGYVALCGFDRVSVVPFPTREENFIPQGALRTVRGRRTAMRYFQHLNQLTAGDTVDFNAALKRGAMEARTTGVAVVISDFLDPAGYEDGLNALVGRGFQVDAIQVLAPDELEPGTYGDLRLVDSEMGTQVEVTFARFRLKTYQQMVANFCQKLREFCKSRGVTFFSVSSDTDLEDLLLKRLREAEVWD